MKAIDRAKQHFESIPDRQITVDQWVDEQGNPLVIWFSPLTVKDRDHLIKLQKRHGYGYELLIRALILHAKDQQGKSLFSLEDKEDLKNNVDPDIVSEIVAVMMAELDPVDLKKKSSPTTNSDSD